MFFELFLTSAAFITGLVVLLDWLYFAPKRRQKYFESRVSAGKPITLKAIDANLPPVIEYCRSFFPILLIVLLFRSFLFEPFRIPSGSLKPSLLVGDYILVNKFAYGMRLPVIDTKIFNVGAPKVGDIAVFRFPVNPTEDYIKRIVGTPGDHIRYENKVLYINDQVAPQQLLEKVLDEEPQEMTQMLLKKHEILSGVSHDIYQSPEKTSEDFDLVVPPGQYFAMGDNRDDSYDSRYWGFVPEKNLAGKAIAVWFSWGGPNYIRWNRIGMRIH